MADEGPAEAEGPVVLFTGDDHLGPAAEMVADPVEVGSGRVLVAAYRREPRPYRWSLRVSFSLTPDGEPVAELADEGEGRGHFIDVVAPAPWATVAVASSEMVPLSFNAVYRTY